MVNKERRLDGLFSALSDPTRRAILAQLASGPASVGELGAPFPISKPAISRHLRVLEETGLIRREQRGRQHFCRLEGPALNEAELWLAAQRAFWESALDRLVDLAAEKPQNGDES